MGYDSRDECESEGCVWDGEKEICSLDFESQRKVVESGGNSIAGAIILVFGVTLFTDLLFFASLWTGAFGGGTPNILLMVAPGFVLSALGVIMIIR